MPNKAIAAGAGGGLAGALTVIGIWAWGHDMPPEVASAFTTVIGALISGLSAYLTPHEAAAG